MPPVCICIFYLLTRILFTDGTVYNEKLRSIFKPPVPAGYFGYSVYLSHSGSLLVGAPKAINPISALKGVGNIGALFNCKYDFSEANKVNPTMCRLYLPEIFGNARGSYNGRENPYVDYKNEMWLGASIAEFPGKSIITCAPRWANNRDRRFHMVSGLCYSMEKATNGTAKRLMPLTNKKKEVYTMVTNARNGVDSYPPAGTIVTFQSYGQAGMSVHVTADQNYLLVGAPGVLHWTGGVIKYKALHDSRRNAIVYSMENVRNPIYTLELKANYYFGSSVSSGKFDPDDPIMGVASAPNALNGLGEVFIFDLVDGGDTYKIRGRIPGSEMGSQFGMALVVLDVNGDGRDDVIVGAPMYSGKYCEIGRVFTFMNTGLTTTHYEFELVNAVSGQGLHRARFGTSIANLGDVDADGYQDVAIGAPNENDGQGAVYIYRGRARGLDLVQKIDPQPSERGFGQSVSSGLDVDLNGCNDLAIGAYVTGSATILRCRPSLVIETLISIPETMTLTDKATNFTAEFCILSGSNHAFQDTVVHLKVNIFSERDTRITINGADEYTEEIKRNSRTCQERIIVIKDNADLTRPIELVMEAEPLYECDFCGRPRDDSKLKVRSGPIQLAQGCGEDLICHSDLQLNLKSLGRNMFIPGKDKEFGIIANVTNAGEPSYSVACLKIKLTTPPLRAPPDCQFELEHMRLVCQLPHPMKHNETKLWKIETELPSFENDSNTKMVTQTALHIDCDSDENVKKLDLTIEVEPLTEFNITGQTYPNFTRYLLPNEQPNTTVTFGHFYLIKNMGPSERQIIDFQVQFPALVELTELPLGCRDKEQEADNTSTIECRARSISPGTPLGYLFTMKTTASYLESLFNENKTAFIESRLRTTSQDIRLEYRLQTEFVLDVSEFPWLIVLSSTIIGLILLAGITYSFYKCGFFQRNTVRKTQNEQSALIEEETASTSNSNIGCDEIIED